MTKDHDVIELHARAVGGFLAIVAGVAPDAWGRPTPCVDWDVRTLVNHVVGEERWAVPLLEGRTIAEVGDSLDGDLLGDRRRHARGEAQDRADRVVFAGQHNIGTYKELMALPVSELVPVPSEIDSKLALLIRASPL